MFLNVKRSSATDFAQTEGSLDPAELDNAVLGISDFRFELREAHAQAVRLYLCTEGFDTITYVSLYKGGIGAISLDHGGICPRTLNGSVLESMIGPAKRGETDVPPPTSATDHLAEPLKRNTYTA